MRPLKFLGSGVTGNVFSVDINNEKRALKVSKSLDRTMSDIIRELDSIFFIKSYEIFTCYTNEIFLSHFIEFYQIDMKNKRAYKNYYNGSLSHLPSFCDNVEFTLDIERKGKIDFCPIKLSHEVMELADGNISAIISDRDIMEPIVIQICLALIEMKEIGMNHNDLHSNNILYKRLNDDEEDLVINEMNLGRIVIKIIDYDCSEIPSRDIRSELIEHNINNIAIEENISFEDANKIFKTETGLSFNKPFDASYDLLTILSELKDTFPDVILPFISGVRYNGIMPLNSLRLQYKTPEAFLHTFLESVY